MPKAKAKLSALLAAAVIAVAGCGGDSDDETSGSSDAAAGKAAAKQAPSAPAKPDRAAGKSDADKGKSNAAKRKKQSAEAGARELARKLKHSGTPIPADSPVAREVLESLTKKQGKKGKNGRKSIDKAVEEVLAQPDGGGGNSSGGQPDDGSVEKILEQIQE